MAFIGEIALDAVNAKAAGYSVEEFGGVGFDVLPHYLAKLGLE